MTGVAVGDRTLWKVPDGGIPYGTPAMADGAVYVTGVVYFADSAGPLRSRTRAARRRRGRVNHWIASQAVVIATGISATGHREILGVVVGDSESKPFWTRQCRGPGPGRRLADS
ncbi:mutator family transposase [Streptomyces sp. TLI_55]|nr:mutator family transposase [Streptomyces sp. TLI_55]